MTEEESGKDSDVQKSTTDYVNAGVRAALGAVPFAGSLLIEIAGHVVPKQRIDRIADFAQRLERRISNLEESHIRAEINDEEFIDLVEEVLRQTTRATTEDRREYLASLIADSLSREAIEHAESRHLLRILGELSDVEVIWLRFYYDPSMRGDDEFRELHKNALEPVAAHLRSSQTEIDKEALQKSYKAHLERLGLIYGKVKTDRNKNPEFDQSSGEIKRQSYQATRLGKLLLRSIGLV